MAENKVVFGRWEMTALLINAITVQVYLGFPRLMVDIGGTAAWMVVVLISLLAMLVFLVISRLFSKFEGKDILDVAEAAAGGIGRSMAGTLFAFYIIVIIALVLREYAEDMKIIALTVTPISFVILFFITGMIFAAFIGVESIMRFHALAVPVIIFGFLVIVIGVAPYYDLTNLLPVFGNGLDSILVSGSFRISSFTALIALFILFPFIKTNKNFKKAGMAAIIVSGAIMLLAVLSYTMVFPYPTSDDNLLPIFQMARLINYGRFFQRIEAIFVFIWATSALLYLSFGFFLTVHIFKKAFGLKYHRPLILPFAVITFSIAMLPKNLMDAIKLEGGYGRALALIISFGLTLLILLIAVMAKKGQKKAGVKK